MWQGRQAGIRQVGRQANRQKEGEQAGRQVGKEGRIICKGYWVGRWCREGKGIVWDGKAISG